MPAALELARNILDDTRTWGDRAACVGKASILENPNETPAKTMCAHCPVIADCSTWVFGLTRRQDPGGVIAGMNENQRNRARRRARALKAPAKKKCSACGETKARTEFYFSKRDGLSSICRICHNKQTSECRRRRKAAA